MMRLGRICSISLASLFTLSPMFSVVAANADDPLLDAYSKAEQSRPRIERSARPPAILHFNKHDKLAHMYITQKAYELYNARYPGSELGRYIGDYVPNQPPLHTQGTVIEGSYDEDISHENPFDDLIPVVKHFWHRQGGYYAGLYGADSSVNRAHKYFSGGYGIEGKYDTDWSQNTGIRRGVKDHGIITLYRLGDKSKAYWYLGHVAHLLEDLTVPAHEQLWPHADLGSDAYETYMSSNYSRWNSLPNDAIELFPTLYQIFDATAKVSDRYDAGFGPGEDEGIDGSVDKGDRRKRKFPAKDLDEEADVLMPLAFEKVAALFRYFYKTVDQAPPRTELRLKPEGSRVCLEAFAESISGVDRSGYRFEFAEIDGVKRTWMRISPSPTISMLVFSPKPGVTYAFRVKAENGAGRIGVSDPVYFPARLIASR